jgi:(R)-2-hydroxyacyl-CoA dehydratese activating ATPase
MVVAGIDAGSRAIKAALMDGGGEILAKGVADQGVAQEALALGLIESLLAERDLTRDDLTQVVATGYGRNIVAFADRTVTEITCHAHGVRHVAPDARTIIEIGGQDSKVIKLDGQGAVQDFMMNDRCAAGTGRFLEVVADRLQVGLEALGELAGRSTSPAAISSMCVVFAETEIIGLLAAGAEPEDIVAGVQNAIAKRLSAMAGRSVDEPVVFTGGVALVSGMTEAVASVLNRPVRIVPDPQFTGAIGAALLAARQ